MTDIPVRCKGNHHVLKSGPSNSRITEAEALDIAYHRDVDDSLERMLEAGIVVFEGQLDRDKIAQNFALGRIGQPDDVASATCYLLSDMARFVTGTVHTVDGGMAMRG